MENKQRKRLGAATLIAGAVAATGAAAFFGLPAAHADAATVVAHAVCAADAFTGPDLTGTVAHMRKSEPNNEFDVFNVPLGVGGQSVLYGLQSTDTPADVKSHISSVRLTCTYTSVNGANSSVKLTSEVNPRQEHESIYRGTGVPLTDTDGTDGVAVVKGDGTPTTKTYVINQLPESAAGDNFWMLYLAYGTV